MWVLDNIGNSLVLRSQMMERKLKFFGHVMRHESFEKGIIQGMVEAKRKRGRPPREWMDDIKGWTGLRPCSHHSFGTGTVPERNRAPCSHLFHCVRSFRNEPTTSRCDRSGTIPERVRLALWCERATGPVPEPFQLPVTFVDSQPILHISKRSSLHGILKLQQIV